MFIKLMVFFKGILLWEVWSGGLVPYTGLNLQKAAEQVQTMISHGYTHCRIGT